MIFQVWRNDQWASMNQMPRTNDTRIKHSKWSKGHVMGRNEEFILPCSWVRPCHDTVLEVARAGPGSEMSPSPLTRTTLASFCRRQQRKMLSLRILDADYKQKINMNSARDYLLLSQHRTQDGAEGWGWVSVYRDCLLLERLVLISSGPDLICNF